MTATQQRYAYDTATEVKIVAFWCPGCGLPYGLPAGYLKARRDDGKRWTCPNGCVRRRPDRWLAESLSAASAPRVCPCCNRTFQNVARHIAGQHPDYADLGTESEG